MMNIFKLSVMTALREHHKASNVKGLAIITSAYNLYLVDVADVGFLYFWVRLFFE